MKIRPLLIALVATTLLAASADAQNRFAYPKSYVQLAGLYALCSFNGANAPNHCDEFDSSFGFNFRGGVRMNRWFAVEGQVEWASGYDHKSPGTIPPPPSPPIVPPFTSVTLDSVAYTINARLYLTEGRIQPYAIAGIGGQNSWLDTNRSSSDTFTSFIGRFGGGVDLYVTDNLALTGEFTYVAATEASATYYGYYWNDFYTKKSGIDPSYMAISWGLLYSF